MSEEKRAKFTLRLAQLFPPDIHYFEYKNSDKLVKIVVKIPSSPENKNCTQKLVKFIKISEIKDAYQNKFNIISFEIFIII